MRPGLAHNRTNIANTSEEKKYHSSKYIPSNWPLHLATCNKNSSAMVEICQGLTSSSETKYDHQWSARVAGTLKNGALVTNMSAIRGFSSLWENKKYRNKCTQCEVVHLSYNINSRSGDYTDVECCTSVLLHHNFICDS